MKLKCKDCTTELDKEYTPIHIDKGVVSLRCPSCGGLMMFMVSEWMFEVERTWSERGLTPVIISCLMSEGWYYEDLEATFGLLVGEDWYRIKQTEWVERLESIGRTVPDGIPVYWVWKKLLTGESTII